MRTGIHVALLSALVICFASSADGKKAYTMHTVFSAECTPYFDVSALAPAHTGSVQRQAARKNASARRR